MNLQEIDGGWIQGALIGLGALPGALMYLRRKHSSDATKIAGDKAERSQISRLEDEIGRLKQELADAKREAKEAEAESDRQRELRAVDGAMIATLESDAKFRNRGVKLLPAEMRRVFVDTGMAPLDETKPPAADALE